MIPYDIDPSLHDAEPAPVRLDDGFSPPPPSIDDQGEHRDALKPASIGDKSPF